MWTKVKGDKVITIVKKKYKKALKAKTALESKWPMFELRAFIKQFALMDL